jgi:hypothetical protein
MTTLNKTKGIQYKVFLIPKKTANYNKKKDICIDKKFCSSFLDINGTNSNKFIHKLAKFTNSLSQDTRREIISEFNLSNYSKKFFKTLKESFYGYDKNSAEHLRCFSELLKFLEECVIPRKEDHRVILAPKDELKQIQSEIGNQLNRFRPHENAFGFAKNKSALDSVNLHLFKNEKPELLINVDVKNFFGSFTEEQIKDSLLAHGIIEEDASNIIDICSIKLNKANISKLVSLICCSVINLNHLRKTLIERFIGSKETNSYLYPRSRYVSVERQHQIFLSGDNRADTLENFCVLFPIHGQLTQSNIEEATKKDHEILKLFISSFIERCVINAFENKWANKERILNIVKDLFNIGPLIKFDDHFLPQGSPASPVITNIAFKLLDYRLTRLSEEKGAVYSRYADDLSFTWPTRYGKKFINIFIYKIGKILSSNGFELNKKKSKVIGTGGRMEILGYVMNSGKPTIAPAYVEAVRTEILKLKDKIKNGMIQNELRFLSECSKINGKINFIASAMPHKADKLSSLLLTINPPISNRRKILVD